MSKFSINKDLLVRELTFVCSTINEKAANQQWRNVLLETDGTHVIIMGTDGMSAAKTRALLAKPVDEPVSIAITGKKLLEVVKLITHDTVNFSETEGKITVSAGKGRYSFGKNPQAASHIKPLCEMGDTGETFTIGRKAFTDAIRVGTVFAAKEDSTKYTLAGVLVEAKDNGLYSRAMDGFRAVDASFNDPMPERNNSMFVMQDCIPLVTSIVGDYEKIVVTKAATTLTFATGKVGEPPVRVAKVRRAASENLPNIAGNLDKFLATYQVTAEASASDLIGAVKRMQTASDGKYRKVKFTVKDGVLNLFANDALTDAKEFEEEITATTQGTGECTLHALYVLDFLKHAEGNIKFHIGESQQHPVVITNEHGLRGLIMQLV